MTEFAARFYTPRTLQGKELPDTNKTSTPDTRGLPERHAQGRLLALDLGRKRVGVALSDELGITVSPQAALPRTNWKELLRAVNETLLSFDAKGLVIGLPLNMNGSEGEAAREARRLASNFEKSLRVPVYLQDERLTSREAEASLREAKHAEHSLRGLVDSESAAIILRDFLDRENHSPLPPEPSKEAG